jgi:hypothetical protein
MNYKTRLVRGLRRILGTSPEAIADLVRRFEELERQQARIFEMTSRIHHLSPETHHLIVSISSSLQTLLEDADTLKPILEAINHRASLLEAIGPRIQGLDELRHMLVYAEAIASDHARSARLDAESIAILLTTINRLTISNQSIGGSSAEDGLV